MSEPSREHVEAVGATVRDEIKKYPVRPKPETYDPFRYSHLTFGATEHTIARAILTSTDPAVLDAMQDALVRAGRLRPIDTVWDIQNNRVRRRLVTEWEEVEE